MISSFDRSFVTNVFQQLDTECSLVVLGLCLASHDMVSHHRLMDNAQDEEASYHFPASLSILREVAKIIQRIDKLPFRTRLSQHTTDLFQDIKEHLVPFQDDSLTKGALKPIRDLTFHYDFAEGHQDKIGPLLAELKSEQKLTVRATNGDDSIFRFRYTFADAFRSKLVASYLTKDVVDQISVAAVKVIAFTDSLLADLSG